MSLCKCGCGIDAGVYLRKDRPGKPQKEKSFINGHFFKGKSKKTHCIRGHARSPNSVWPNGTCKICTDTYVSQRVWPKTPAGKRSVKNTGIKLRYGITLDQQEDMLKKQGGLCRICSVVLDSSTKNQIPHIDHVHVENELRYSVKTVRGLLCGLCNRGLGQFKDSLDLLEKAIQYLKETQ